MVSSDSKYYTLRHLPGRAAAGRGGAERPCGASHVEASASVDSVKDLHKQFVSLDVTGPVVRKKGNSATATSYEAAMSE